ncbi:MAG: hypothetical protein HP491_11100 [Nitrospira sp.]|nr:hypothetical protein [Nitrospira sp.]MBH0180335.1 hypothetical protein [Nitrospira sp.]MBH0183927.1 hypothetical protein [Nitrospira sp.]
MARDKQRWILRQLRRSARARFLLNELAHMDEPGDQALQRAISAILQSDPLIKLLQQVRLGRMQPTDAGLRAVTESWLGIYEKTLDTAGLTRSNLRRINPMPRLAVLIDSGVLAVDHPGVASLKASYDRVLARASTE